MKKYKFKNNEGITQEFTAPDLFTAKKMAFNYFKTNLIEQI